MTMNSLLDTVVETKGKPQFVQINECDETYLIDVLEGFATFIC